MSLDYKKSYKDKLKHRKIMTISVIVVVFLLASFSILYFKFWSKESQGKSSEPTQDSIAMGADESAGKMGMPLQRQPIHLYTIGVARINLNDVNREYVRVEETVSDAYFEDALFIGDSRTEGFMLYTSLSNIRAYCSKGLSVSRIYSDAVVNMEDGRTVTVMEALQEQKFQKIYIMFGVNELGWPYDELFQEQYSKVIQDIRNLQPDALIYVQNIIPISAERSAKDAIYNNENVTRFNGMVETICNEQNVIYLDVASALADETGALPADASTDGVHCNREYCDKWLEYLKNNTYELR